MSRRRTHHTHPDPKKLRFHVSDDAVKIFRYTDGENPFFNSPALNTGLEDLQWLRKPENLVKGNFKLHPRNLDQGKYRVDSARVEIGNVKINDLDQLTGSIFHDRESEDEKDDDDHDHDPLELPNSSAKLMQKASNAVSKFYKTSPKNILYLFIGAVVLMSLLATPFSNYHVRKISLPESLKYSISDLLKWLPTRSASPLPVEEPHTIWTGYSPATTTSQWQFLKASMWFNPTNWPAMTDFVKGSTTDQATIQTTLPTVQHTFKDKPTDESNPSASETTEPMEPRQELFDRLLSLHMDFYHTPLLPVPHLSSLRQTTHHASQTFKFSAWRSIANSPYKNELIISAKNTKAAINNLETIMNNWKSVVEGDEATAKLLKETLGEMEEFEGHRMGNLRSKKERIKTERTITKNFHDLLFLAYHNAEKSFTHLHALKVGLLELPNDDKDFKRFISLEKKTRKSKGNKQANEGLKGQKKDLAKLVALKKGLLPEIEEAGKRLEKLLEGKKDDLGWFGNGKEDREFDYEGFGVQVMGLRVLLRDVEKRLEEAR
ncbi:hypothetical protein B0J14DRAFT_652913 [Halenospora varia]|nr:hypothetical protein B0J14DRAFT_652913 [Halenospora varia]